jgi:hypothetical protein
MNSVWFQVSLTGWDVLTIAIGWAVGSFIWGFGAALGKDVRRWWRDR